jgi:rubrerythrin
MEMNPSFQELLSMMIAHEEAIGGLYQEYGERFPTLASFWRELAAEEHQHAGWLRRLEEMADFKGLFADEHRFKVEAIRTSLNFIKEERFKLALEHPTPAICLNKALIIEESLIEKKYFEVFTAIGPEHRRILENIAAETQTHARRIRQKLSELGTKQY